MGRADGAGQAAVVSELHARDPSSRASAEQVWAWFQEASLQFEKSKALNSQLALRISELEAELSGRISDDRLLAELPDRVSQVLKSANDARVELLKRANEQVDHLVKQASNEALVLTSVATDRAREILRESKQKARLILADADRTRQGILEEVYEEQDRVLTDLAVRKATLEDEMQRVQLQLTQLRDSYGAVARMVNDALRSSMRTDGQPPPVIARPSADPVTPRAAAPPARPAVATEVPPKGPFVVRAP